ncbi:MAG: response regulator [Lachnospiraceae bacterium]|nr:response regulator [Lachnospiraceae bacterium]
MNERILRTIDNAIETKDAADGSTADSEEDEDTSEHITQVVVVDDVKTNLISAGEILSENGMDVTGITSGEKLLEYVKTNRPDIILLDVYMPEMDGFETLEKLREMEGGYDDIPVIFLTGSDSFKIESRGLKLGAMDFIKKPFDPDVLVLRVKNTVELVRLQKDLSAEVRKKSKENEAMSLHVVQTLAEAIDAKDTYTNGHSTRVAQYSREIARRYGYSRKAQDEIYMMGLLHDVGKIGVPDEVINKTAKLSDEEFELIKEHPVIGYNILAKIKEMPRLQAGAHWHHERYDGTGYPDGLSEDDICEEARIIAVADAYDAMTSYRSYRDVLPQNVVADEIKKGRGKQFDPKFADIMLEMISEDVVYGLREKRSVQ